MEWVEVEGSTVDEAVALAMGELGIDRRDDAEVQVIQEPKAGFLGMGGKTAIVKVTRARQTRRRRRGRGRNGDDRGGKAKSGRPDRNQKDRKAKQEQRSNQGNSRPSRSAKPKGDKKMQQDDRPEPAPIEEQATVAVDFLTGLLDAFGLEGSVASRIDEDVLYLDIEGEQTEALVGSKGSVMFSVLELTRTVVQRKTYGAPRMRIDVNGYAERRREALKIYTGKLAAQVVEEQGEVMLEPMNAADRKVVHDAVAEIEHVRSFSEGEDPRRAVVLAYEE
jgi:spoIIIJ-associated protein